MDEIDTIYKAAIEKMLALSNTAHAQYLRQEQLDEIDLTKENLEEAHTTLQHLLKYVADELGTKTLGYAHLRAFVAEVERLVSFEKSASLVPIKRLDSGEIATKGAIGANLANPTKDKMWFEALAAREVLTAGDANPKKDATERVCNILTEAGVKAAPQTLKNKMSAFNGSETAATLGANWFGESDVFHVLSKVHVDSANIWTVRDTSDSLPPLLRSRADLSANPFCKPPEPFRKITLSSMTIEQVNEVVLEITRAVLTPLANRVSRYER